MRPLEDSFLIDIGAPKACRNPSLTWDLLTFVHNFNLIEEGMWTDVPVYWNAKSRKITSVLTKRTTTASVLDYSISPNCIRCVSNKIRHSTTWWHSPLTPESQRRIGQNQFISPCMALFIRGVSLLHILYIGYLFVR